MSKVFVVSYLNALIEMSANSFVSLKMVSNDNYCLRLNEFEGNVKLSWKELETDKDFCDVTQACEDKQIKTHRLIISSFSPVLRNILKFNQAPHFAQFAE